MTFYDDLMRLYAEYKSIKNQTEQDAKTIKRLERQVVVLNVALRIAQGDRQTDVARDLDLAPSHSVIQEARRLVRDQPTEEPSPVDFAVYGQGDPYIMVQQTKPVKRPSVPVRINDDGGYTLPAELEELGARAFIDSYLQTKGDNR